MAFTELTQTERFKPSHKFEGESHHASMQFAVGDTSFNTMWKAMSNATKYDDMLAGFTLVDNSKPMTSNEKFQQAGGEQIKDSATLGKRVEGRVEEDVQKNEDGTIDEVHRNDDGSTVHVHDGKVSRIDYKDGGHTDFQYGPHGTVDRIEQVNADGSKQTIQRLAQDNPDGTPRYSFHCYDKHGKLGAHSNGMNDAQAIVYPDGSFSFSFTFMDNKGKTEYTNMNVDTKGNPDYSKGEKPATDAVPTGNDPF
jgi:hypothetical protein